MAHHFSTENLVRVLDALVIRPRWAAAMASIGASEETAFKWLAKSRAAMKDQDESSPCFLEWREVWDFWHVHCGRARRESLVAYDALIRDQCFHGIEVPILDAQGRQLWKTDPLTVGKDDDALDLEFGEGKWSRILRDNQGRAQPLTRTEQVPATTRNKVLDQIGGYRDAAPSVHVHNNLHVSSPLKALRRAPAGPGEQASLPAPSQTPMVRDLLEHLKAASDPNRKTAKPDPTLKPVEIMGRATGDKPDQVSTFPADVPQTLADHPRAYTAEPTLVPAAKPNYARRLSSGGIDQAGMGKGPDPSLIGKSRGFRTA
jgi:hypothetical protein